jgi:hypothetical protein
MSDLTPPPEEPLSDQARARIRAELLATAAGTTRRDANGGVPRWVVPAVAAAAVVLVAAASALIVRSGGSDGQLAPATLPTKTPSAAVSNTPLPTLVPSRNPAAANRGSSGGSADCAAEVANVLSGAEQAAEFPADRAGSTGFWVKGQQFVLCDVRDGNITVHQPQPLVGTGTGVAPYRVSSISPPSTTPNRTIWVAGGVVPDKALAYDVRYTFPDGHTEAATTTDDQGRTWWRMIYGYPEGPSRDHGKPIRVVVSYSGVQHTYELKWGIDTCAQANRGC